MVDTIVVDGWLEKMGVLFEPAPLSARVVWHEEKSKPFWKIESHDGWLGDDGRGCKSSST